jgi:PDZ domain
MKALLHTGIPLILCVTGLLVGQPSETNGPIVSAPVAWLGVQVAKPDPSITAHLPDLLPGIGFLVTSVDKGGPAERAGLAAFDVIWKFDGQLLVNESQLAALLRLRAPGDDVKLSCFRQGQASEFLIELGKSPERDPREMANLIDASLLPAAEQSVPMRVVRVNEKVASYSTDEGQVHVSKSNDGYQVSITGPDEQQIYQGEMTADGTISGLSEKWVRRVHALRRGLDHQLAAQSSQMASRARGVQPAAPQIGPMPQSAER